MVAPFTYAVYPARVVFGPGRLRELGAELDRLGVRRAPLLTTPEQVGLAEQVGQQLGHGVESTLAPPCIGRRLVPTFRSSCTIAAPTFHELRKAMGTRKLMILVPLFDLKSLGRFRGLQCRDFKSAALATQARRAFPHTKTEGGG